MRLITNVYIYWNISGEEHGHKSLCSRLKMKCGCFAGERPGLRDCGSDPGGLHCSGGTNYGQSGQEDPPHNLRCADLISLQRLELLFRRASLDSFISRCCHDNQHCGVGGLLSLDVQTWQRCHWLYECHRWTARSVLAGTGQHGCLHLRWVSNTWTLDVGVGR